MYNFSAKVIATEIIPDKSIKFDWNASDKPTQVSFTFIGLDSQSTFVTIVHDGFDKTGDELIETLKDSTSGFTLVMAGLKSYFGTRYQSSTGC